MGGAAGHLQHIHEATDLSFRDIKMIIHKALSGNLENTYEKLDGQNLILTWKNNEVLCARTGKHLRNYGADFGIRLSKIRDFFSPNTPDTIRDAYEKAMQDFQDIFESNPDIIKNIFQEGKIWLNAEILYQKTENIIHYGVDQIKIHDLFRIDQAGKKIKNIEGYSVLIKFIERSFCANNYIITSTNHVIINKSKFSYNIILDEVQKLQDKHKLTDRNTLEDYIYCEFYDYVQPMILLGNKDDQNVYLSFAYRWGRKDKTTSITKLLKGVNKELSTFLKTEDKNILYTYRKLTEPLVYLFAILGMEVLKNLDEKTITTQNIDQSILIMKNNIINNILIVSKFLDENEDKRLQYYFDLFNKLGGIIHMVPMEGIVFTYKDKLFKLTGLFTPLLQLIGYFKYKK